MKYKTIVGALLVGAALLSTSLAQVQIQGNVVTKKNVRDLADQTGAPVNVTLSNAASRQTLTLVGNAANTETVTVGGTAYTFQTTLTNVAGNVLIGATASDSIDNLVAAINAQSTLVGIKFAAATVVNANVRGTTGAGDTMIAIAKTEGASGDALGSTETLASGSWGAAVLAGGTSFVLNTTLATNYNTALTANRTIDFREHKAGRTFRLKVAQDATGSRLMTWDAEVAWPGAAAPTLTTTASRSDLFEFYDNGTKYLGRTVALDYIE